MAARRQCADAAGRAGPGGAVGRCLDVAIDVQLYALLALLCAVRAAWRGGDSARCGRLTGVAVVVLTGLSLLWLNRDADLDIWAVYFVGAYGLGVLAQWARTSTRRGLWVGAIVVLTALALLVEWRSRLALAGCVALVLALDIGRGWRWLAHGPVRTAVAFLSRISYTVFLMHYPVSLVVGRGFLPAVADLAGDVPDRPDRHLVAEPAGGVVAASGAGAGAGGSGARGGSALVGLARFDLERVVPVGILARATTPAPPPRGRAARTARPSARIAAHGPARGAASAAAWRGRAPGSRGRA